MSFFIIFNKLLQNLRSRLPQNITWCLQVLDSSTECFSGLFQGNFELSLQQIFGHHLFLIQALQVNMKGILKKVYMCDVLIKQVCFSNSAKPQRVCGNNGQLLETLHRSRHLTSPKCGHWDGLCVEHLCFYLAATRWGCNTS